METEIIVLDEEMKSDPNIVREVSCLVEQGADLTGSDCTWMIAVTGKVLTGVIGFTEYCPAELVWLYVVPEERRKGIATMLFRAMRDYMMDNLIFSEIYTSFIIDARTETSDLYDFFNSIEDTDLSRENGILEITPDSLKAAVTENKLFQKEAANEVEKFFMQSQRKVMKFLGDESLADIFTISDMTEYRKSIINELCLCTLEGSTITSAILASRLNEDTISIDLLYSKKKSRNVLDLINVFGHEMMKNYSDCTLVCSAINEKVEQFMKSIFNKVGVRGYVCEVSWIGGNIDAYFGDT